MLPRKKQSTESGTKEKRKMEKMGLLKNEKMGEYEKEQGRASYLTLVNYFIGDRVLCNNIVNIDDSVYMNMENAGENSEIYQYFICNIGGYDREQALRAGLILSYSDMLDCDVLCVDHFGTSWDYVLTDVKLFDNWEELKQYEQQGEEE